jgi:hypothetical protein
MHASEIGAENTRKRIVTAVLLVASERDAVLACVGEAAVCRATRDAERQRPPPAEEGGLAAVLAGSAHAAPVPHAAYERVAQAVVRQVALGAAAFVWMYVAAWLQRLARSVHAGPREFVFERERENPRVSGERARVCDSAGRET